MKFLLIVILILFNSMAFAQNKKCAPVLDIPEHQRAYDHGERLVYIINYTWGVINTDVGEATVTLTKKNNRNWGDYFHSVITGNTYRFYDVFFKVRDLFESKFSPVNGRPFYFHRDVSEGKYTMKNTYFFNPDFSINATV